MTSPWDALKNIFSSNEDARYISASFVKKYILGKEEESQLVSFARKELELAGMFDEDADYNGELANGVMELIKLFASDGHSGYSAKTTADIFYKLATYTPLTALTGEESEWVEVAEGLYQNKRYASVFKQDGQAYDIDARVVSEDGVTWNPTNDKVNITFPYTPSKEYVWKNAIPFDDDTMQTMMDEVGNEIKEAFENHITTMESPEPKNV